MKKYNIFNKRSLLFLGLTMSVFCSHAQIGNATTANLGKELYVAHLYNYDNISTLELRVIVYTTCNITAKYNQSNTY